MKKLQDIKKEYEAIVSITITGDYNNHQLIMDKDIHDDDVSQIMEYTLHRMVDANFTPEEIYYNSGIFVPTEEYLEELEEYGEYTNIDLGYILGGLITSIKY